MATMDDPKFLAGTKKQKMEIAPIPGPEVAAKVAELYRTPQNVIELAMRATTDTTRTKTEKAVIPTEEIEGTITKIEREGRKVSVERDGKRWAANVSGSKTTITIGGNDAKRNALAVGMTCKLTYQGTLAKGIRSVMG